MRIATIGYAYFAPPSHWPAALELLQRVIVAGAWVLHRHLDGADGSSMSGCGLLSPDSASFAARCNSVMTSCR